MKNGLRQLLKALSHFDADELDAITGCFIEKNVKRNEFLLQSGDVCREFYFVYKGGLRTFFIDRNGHEKTRYVMLDCSIGTALTGFIEQKPSVEFIQAVDDTQLLAIAHHDFFRLVNEMPHWSAFYRRMLEMAYTFQNKRIEQLVTLTAAQRYEKVQQENPALIQRLPNKILASYLDVREETLSRLKAH